MTGARGAACVFALAVGAFALHDTFDPAESPSPAPAPGGSEKDVESHSSMPAPLGSAKKNFFEVPDSALDSLESESDWSYLDSEDPEESEEEQDDPRLCPAALPRDQLYADFDEGDVVQGGQGTIFNVVSVWEGDKKPFWVRKSYGQQYHDLDEVGAEAYPADYAARMEMRITGEMLPMHARVRNAFQTQRKSPLGFDLGVDYDLIMPLYYGDAWNRLSELQELDIERLQSLTTQLALGLALVHKKGYILNDVKLENVMFTDKALQHAVFIDYGAACSHDVDGFRDALSDECTLETDWGFGGVAGHEDHGLGLVLQSLWKNHAVGHWSDVSLALQKTKWEGLQEMPLAQHPVLKAIAMSWGGVGADEVMDYFCGVCKRHAEVEAMCGTVCPGEGWMFEKELEPLRAEQQAVCTRMQQWLDTKKAP